MTTEHWVIFPGFLSVGPTCLVGIVRDHWVEMTSSWTSFRFSWVEGRVLSGGHWSLSSHCQSPQIHLEGAF